MRLDISVSSLMQFSSESKNITGIVYWQAGETSFPESDWNDFVLIVLIWWVDGLIDLVGGVADTRKMRFMDGPFAINVERIDERQCNVQF